MFFFSFFLSFFSSCFLESLPPSIFPGKQSQTLCRNILIHGYCKFENSGCIFRHDTNPTTIRAPSQQSPVKSDLLVDSLLLELLMECKVDLCFVLNIGPSPG
ncbi:hypothetical protein V1514DRAFT_325000 [Lipomyces japonicus]|uniref:uncharacterized protein n=1 Tax=Lipomyces japonicus TaxID=56871 RepID=UPI0034CFAF87